MLLPTSLQPFTNLYYAAENDVLFSAVLSYEPDILCECTSDSGISNKCQFVQSRPASRVTQNTLSN